MADHESFDEDAILELAKAQYNIMAIMAKTSGLDRPSRLTAMCAAVALMMISENSDDEAGFDILLESIRRQAPALRKIAGLPARVTQ